MSCEIASYTRARRGRNRQSAGPSAENGVLEIIPPSANTGRARTVVSRSRSRPTGKYPSWKTGRMVEWESHNELNALRLLDADPNIRTFREQPLTIRYALDGEVHLHFPDVLVDRVCGRELWEIKPAAHACDPKVVARTRLLECPACTRLFVSFDTC